GLRDRALHQPQWPRGHRTGLIHDPCLHGDHLAAARTARGSSLVARVRRANLDAVKPSAPGPAEAVLDLVTDGADLIVPLANGEPVSVLDAIEANATRWRGV